MAGYPKDYYVTPEPHMELTTDRKKLMITQPLPGVSKDLLEVDVHDAGFCINFKPEGKKAVHKCHTLANKIDPDTAEAKFMDGVLNITVNLKEVHKGKKIQIQ